MIQHLSPIPDTMFIVPVRDGSDKFHDQ